jgi:hypothetical protein
VSGGMALVHFISAGRKTDGSDLFPRQQARLQNCAGEGTNALDMRDRRNGLCRPPPKQGGNGDTNEVMPVRLRRCRRSA